MRTSYNFLFTKIFLFLSLAFIISACTESNAEKERVSEVEFRIDSSYFDFSVRDSFFNMSLPHLKGWNRTISDSTIRLQSDSFEVLLRFNRYAKRQPNSYSFYKETYSDSSSKEKILDLSNYLKDGKKLTQLIAKKDNQLIFKTAHDGTVYSGEFVIELQEAQYTENNILLIESIIGQTHFITK